MSRRRDFATFALFVVVAEIVGRSASSRLDQALHVRPLASPSTNYYPFLLVGLKAFVALALAALLARLVRAQAASSAAGHLLAAVGRRHEHRSPRLRPGLSPRVWLASFAATSVAYLVHSDVASAAAGRWTVFEPWLHGYGLPVFAAISVLVAVAWRFAGWLDEVEAYASRTFARVRRLLSVSLTVLPARPRNTDDAAPRRRFGLSFESRPPPLPA